MARWLKRLLSGSGRLNREAVSDLELEAFLDEGLSLAEMAALEARLRKDHALAERLRALVRQRDAGTHSLGAIWRRHRISCPSREELGNYLLQVLPDDHARFIRFHLETTGCRYCQANLQDMQAGQREDPGASAKRRRRYFESSAGHLRRR